jgi:hypothetical protein
MATIRQSGKSILATDGFAFYTKAIRRVFGPACLYGQVIKTGRNDRIIKVERRAVIGADWRLEKMLADSEDSSKLHTSFIERLNLTIRQESSYLFRWTIRAFLWRHNTTGLRAVYCVALHRTPLRAFEGDARPAFARKTLYLLTLNHDCPGILRSFSLQGLAVKPCEIGGRS